MDDFEGLRNGFESLDIDFEGLEPSNRAILGKRQPLFFTPREKLTSNLTIFEALARLEIRLRDLCGREKAAYVFWLYFCCFYGPLCPAGHIGEGRLKEGEGGGLIDLKNLRSRKDLNLVVQNKTGQFFSF